MFFWPWRYHKHPRFKKRFRQLVKNKFLCILFKKKTKINAFFMFIRVETAFFEVRAILKYNLNVHYSNK
jgi:hypothetical protein